MKTILITSIIFYTAIAQGSNSSLYDFKWLDEDEKVYVIQNKEFTKAGKMGLELLSVTSDSSTYHDTIGGALVFNYYLSELFSLDLTYKKYSNSENADFKNLKEALGTEIKPILRIIDDAVLVHTNWIPFYGKLNLFNKIVFFDLGFGLGYGQFNTQGNYETFEETNTSITFKKEVDTGYNFKTFLKMFISEGMTFGIEYHMTGIQTIKNAEGTKELLLYSDALFSFGAMF